MQSGNVTDYAKIKKIREGVRAIDTLPTIPVTLEKIFSILEDENKSARDLENIIKYDQSLSAKIITVANSAFYGLRMQVTTISRAVVAIGFTEVKNLAMSVALMNFFKTKVKFPGFSVDGFWLHSIGVGIVSRMIARITANIDAESLFTCGIVHDIGRVALCAYFPEDFRSILDVKNEEDCSMLEAEERHGLKHTLVGRWLAEKWQFPEAFIQAISCHHHPYEQKTFLPAAGIVQLADILVHRAGIGEEPDDGWTCSASLLKDLELTQDYVAGVEEGLCSLKDVIRETWGSLISV
ncbi:MAG: HDOD domain-containing protein [Thermodesulfobacteriota bacterium]